MSLEEYIEWYIERYGEEPSGHLKEKFERINERRNSK
jgi:hypothetical protein